MAVDEDKPTLRSNVPVTVAIDDVNDHSPVFEFPAAENRTFEVWIYSGDGNRLVKTRVNNESRSDQPQ